MNANLHDLRILTVIDGADLTQSDTSWKPPTGPNDFCLHRRESYDGGNGNHECHSPSPLIHNVEDGDLGLVDAVARESAPAILPKPQPHLRQSSSLPHTEMLALECLEKQPAVIKEEVSVPSLSPVHINTVTSPQLIANHGPRLNTYLSNNPAKAAVQKQKISVVS